MTNRVQVGTMLIEDGTHTPESLLVATHASSKGWSSITGYSSAQLGRAIESAGWTFFYMAGEIQARGFGLDEQSRIDHAVAHLINAVKLQGCNCLEITEIRQRSFLGLSFISLTAHARHIKKSRAFHDPSAMPTSASLRPRAPLYNQTACVGSTPLMAGEAAQTWENEGGARTESMLPELST